MTEYEWLASKDPAAMLSWATAPVPPGGHRPPRRHWYPSARKLRLCASAACGGQPQSLQLCDLSDRFADGEIPYAELESFRPSHPDCSWPLRHEKNVHATILTINFDVFLNGQAILLREILGNPFRPVTLPHVSDCAVCRGSGSFLLGSGEDAERIPCHCCPWLTPTVLSLAQAAYEERGRKCGRCGGSGVYHPNPIQSRGCPACQGTGRQQDGTLDPFRLAMLADALEDAGCAEPDTPARIYVVEGGPSCWFVAYSTPDLRQTSNRLHACDTKEGAIRWATGNCLVRKWVPPADPADLWAPWTHREGVGILPRSPHPIIAHLRSPGPHVRGCWTLDLILAKD